VNQAEAEQRAQQLHSLGIQRQLALNDEGADSLADCTEDESAEIKRIFDLLDPNTHKLGIALALAWPLEHDEWVKEVADGQRMRDVTLRRAIVVLDVRYNPLTASDPADWNWSSMVEDDVRVIGSLPDVPFNSEPHVPDITID